LAGGSQESPAAYGPPRLVKFWKTKDTMRILLATTAALEVGAALALMSVPSAVVSLLLGTPLNTPAAVSLGRLAGAALLALGVACWLAHYDASSRAAKGLVWAMVLYNLGAVVILGTAGIQTCPAGIALWPAVVLHAAMTGWCIACLTKRPRQITENTH
jgi:hypothetical protein